ncbi:MULTISPECIES: hypothetical protein [unclassified Coleofasciculus]|uniref:hypothetical protein n=1 Tax=unclassified Coleofasciculus TaxID=2692782 RepID=UPI001880681C|nr:MULTISPECIES: hypothetical protein [unclassified Coleofasciculus]MBE9125830.1 hypothetical protein [Coleofasciculus sp. LEGE 07081]MBE9148985.1 hypothetical protein [Coleofasciculus sp. LEGE 07092]
MTRDLFAHEALAQIPKLLTLLDRNPHSPTYGCFDRNFWQYKIIDFPSGMAQEFVLPLALAYNTPLPDNSFYQEPAIRNWVEAGILYAAASAHPDGSCDDYFPFERAGGAAAFSLLACIESYSELGLNNPVALKFFEKRADWLAHHQESGRLTNHQALIVLCLDLLSNLLQTTKWDRARVHRLEQVLSWQNPEGWFVEYEGCDPGYHTLTISCLARIYKLRPDPRLKEALIKAVELAAEFVHPDGSYGGEYTSRNTYNFFPHGFELVGEWFSDALQINDRFLVGLANGLAPCYADDHIIGHHTWNYLLTWRDFVPDRPAPTPRLTGRVWFKEAQVLIDRRQDTELYLALNKGGVFKVFRGNQLVASDTQFSLQVKAGSKVKNAVGHLVDSYAVKVDDDEIMIEGELGWAKQKQMTPLNLMILRLVMLTVGRFFPNLIRKLLQKMLITGKNKAPFHFRRRLEWQDGHWYVSDELQAKSWQEVIAAGMGGDQTSIYVVMSRTFQKGQLQPWLDLTDEVKKLDGYEWLKLERNF